MFVNYWLNNARRCRSWWGDEVMLQNKTGGEILMEWWLLSVVVEQR